MAELRHMFTKVVGVTHNNRDGKSRQKIIAGCRPLEKLNLKHETDNPVDPNAVAVHRRNGQQLGYLSTELADEVVRRSQQGFRHDAFIMAITGGEPGKEIRGVNLVLTIAEAGVSDRRIQKYMNKLVKDSSAGERQKAKGGCDGPGLTDTWRGRDNGSPQRRLCDERGEESFQGVAREAVAAVVL